MLIETLGAGTSTSTQSAALEAVHASMGGRLTLKVSSASRADQTGAAISLYLCLAPGRGADKHTATHFVFISIRRRVH